MAAIDLTGQTFGRLTALSRAGSRQWRQGKVATWNVACECGATTVVAGVSLRKGITNSCGCLAAETCRTSSRTHGRSKSRVYRVWIGMRNRCENPSFPKFHQYGGRGVRVCERWHTFENFIADMGDPPTDRHTIDRIDSNGNYEPGNCRWATTYEQARNTSQNHWITHNGERLCLRDWAARAGMTSQALGSRLRLGWNMERALSEPVRFRRSAPIRRRAVST